MSQQQIQEERNTRILQITRALVREHSTCHDVQFMAMMIYRTLHDNCPIEFDIARPLNETQLARIIKMHIDFYDSLPGIFESLNDN